MNPELEAKLLLIHDLLEGDREVLGILADLYEQEDDLAMVNWCQNFKKRKALDFSLCAVPVGLGLAWAVGLLRTALAYREETEAAQKLLLPLEAWGSDPQLGESTKSLMNDVAVQFAVCEVPSIVGFDLVCQLMGRAVACTFHALDAESRNELGEFRRSRSDAHRYFRELLAASRNVATQLYQFGSRPFPLIRTVYRTLTGRAKYPQNRDWQIDFIREDIEERVGLVAQNENEGIE